MTKVRRLRSRCCGFADGAAASLTVLLCVVASATSAFAQNKPRQAERQAQRQGSPGAETPGVSPAEIQRMFDSYALMQAQDQLQISDDQFPQFLTRFKALQDIRRQVLQQRTRRIAELRRLLNAPQLDEAAVREQMKGLEELDARAQTDVKRAYDAIDQILNVRQQAKFRVFEELMERRKLELVTRARQANRPKL
jgi:Spy/CpxP family protein refolding chaperone